MLVTLSGIVMLVRPVQPSNALLPIDVTLFPIVTLVRPVQPSNAELWMNLAFSEITQEVIDWLVAFTNTK